ncbi:MAG TPA: ATP-binding protein [Streptosporangiaceae bacterium]|nr:ATP-binding protein [Streptosporangiaceae bacterium]
MTSCAAGTSWSEANQAYLVAEFTRLKRLLTTGNGNGDAAAGAPAAGLDPPPAINVLAELFGLSEFERDIVLLAAGTEMDSQIAELCPRLTLGVALAVLPEPHWSALSPGRPLREFELIRVEAERGLTSAAVRIDERVLHYLAGLNPPDPRIRSLVKPIPAPAVGAVASEHACVAEKALTLLVGRPTAVRLIQLCGDDPDGQEDVAALIALGCGCQPFAVRVEELPPPGPDLDMIAALWRREALLLPALLLVQAGPTGLTPAARQLVGHLPGLAIVACRETVHLSAASLRFDVDKPPPAEQRRLWGDALGDPVQALDAELDVVSEQYRFSAREIRATGTLLAASAGPADTAELWDTCRLLARPRLEGLAQRLTPKSRWEDLVLPEAQMQTLRHLAAQVRHRLQVYETWGFSALGRRGLGVSALFAGDSGTGKTMAAEVLAHELELDLYRIDLSAVVSKYIGETEKNLRQVFDAAELGGSILLFDEADALFARRGEVKDSHDRYANVEVAYLLQRMESYQGLAILTTNLRSSLDRAFTRRLRFTIHFPFPDVEQRERIWTQVFPAAAPTKGIEPAKLAQLKVTGGNIRNIAMNAAFLAAETGEPIGMAHLLEAAGLEADKLEHPISDAETRGWA